MSIRLPNDTTILKRVLSTSKDDPRCPDGYIPYKGKYLFFSDYYLCVLNDPHGFSQTTRPFMSEDTINKVCKGDRGDSCWDISAFDSRLPHYDIHLQDLFSVVEENGGQTKCRTPYAVGRRYYNASYVFDMCCLLNRYTAKLAAGMPGDTTMEVYIKDRRPAYLERNATLCGMWIFNEDGECAYILPINPRCNPECNEEEKEDE